MRSLLKKTLKGSVLAVIIVNNIPCYNSRDDIPAWAGFLGGLPKKCSSSGTNWTLSGKFIWGKTPTQIRSRFPIDLGSRETSRVVFCRSGDLLQGGGPAVKNDHHDRTL